MKFGLAMQHRSLSVIAAKRSKERKKQGEAKSIDE
jgi:hypothetical protein